MTGKELSQVDLWWGCYLLPKFVRAKILEDRGRFENRT